MVFIKIGSISFITTTPDSPRLLSSMTSVPAPVESTISCTKPFLQSQSTNNLRPNLWHFDGMYWQKLIISMLQHQALINLDVFVRIKSLLEFTSKIIKDAANLSHLFSYVVCICFQVVNEVKCSQYTAESVHGHYFAENWCLDNRICTPILSGIIFSWQYP